MLIKFTLRLHFRRLGFKTLLFMLFGHWSSLSFYCPLFGVIGLLVELDLLGIVALRRSENDKKLEFFFGGISKYGSHTDKYDAYL